jgi:hypothetical protein
VAMGLTDSMSTAAARHLPGSTPLRNHLPGSENGKHLAA